MTDWTFGWNTTLFYQVLSTPGFSSAFLLDVHMLYGAIEGRLSHFLPCTDGLVECAQPGRSPLKDSATAGNWTQATRRKDSELSHWAIMTRATGRTDSEISHWAIMTRATGRTDSEISHWAIMTRATGRTDSEIYIFILTLSYNHWSSWHIMNA